MRGGELHSRTKSGFNDMSMRDVSILRLMCEEMTTKEIAANLGLQKRTIDGHKTKLFERIGAKSMIGLVKYSIKNKIYEI